MGDFVPWICNVYSQFKHLSAVPGISPYLRKVAMKLKHKKVIEQHGDQCVIKTLTALRNYNLSFRVGQEFQEFTQGLDNRHMKVRMGDGEYFQHCVMCFTFILTGKTMFSLCAVTGDMAGE